METEKVQKDLKKLLKNRTLVLLVAALLVAAVFFLLWWSAGSKRDDLLAQLQQTQDQLEREQLLCDALQKKVNEAEAEANQRPVITTEEVRGQLNGLQDLVTQEYIYTNAARRESKDTWMFGWTRPFSSNSILISYDGYIKAGIDLSAVEVSVEEEARTITVTLPRSGVTDNNILQESIEVLEVKNGLFNEVTIDDYNQFVSEEKLVMEEKAIDRGLLTQADAAAAEAVKALLSLIPGIDTYTLTIQ